MGRCTHPNVRLGLELYDSPIWWIGYNGEPRKDEKASRTTWMGAVSVKCEDCGKSERYTGSQVPKWVREKLALLPIWGRVEDRTTRVGIFRPSEGAGEGGRQ